MAVNLVFVAHLKFKSKDARDEVGDVCPFRAELTSAGP
jgi:hypothetical protein